jgi:putative transposase
MERKPYTSDLTDEQWQRLERFLPKVLPWGRPREYSYREILNAIFYCLRAGCQWRDLPHDLPPWSLVYYYYWHWRKEGLWQRIHDTLVQEVRQKEGREPTPSAAIIDTQSVKTTETSRAEPGKEGDPGEPTVGYDAGKQVKGRKRHLVVDTIGLLMGLRVHSAGIQDRDGIKPLLEKIQNRFPRLKRLWADGNYAGQLIDWVKEQFHWELEIVSRPKEQKGFKVLPRRWVVERTLSWLGKYRRLSKDYETTIVCSEGMIYGAMIHLMIRRLCPPKPS